MDFQKGETIRLSNGDSAEVVRKLGEGGQGAVYEVAVGEQNLALKWYTCTFPNPQAFIHNMKAKIIKDGAPNEHFLWPLYFAEEQRGSFGYVMHLRPPEFSDFADFLNAKTRFPSMEKRILAALNFVSAFRSLHIKGFSYQDLNDGNFFIDMNTGRVLICDNDNVTPGNSMNVGQVGGKPGYMAPEVVTGEKHPSTLTDYYSLAVILFKLFVAHDPLMGAKYVKLTQQDTLPVVEMELYGKNPVFIFDPHTEENRPVPGIHLNPLNLWPLYPEFFQDAFVSSFVEGVQDPNQRLPENAWQRTLIRLRDELSVCPNCSEEFFWKGQKTACDCGAVFDAPGRLSVNSYRVPVFPGQKLYACHTVGSSEDYASVTGQIVTSKKNAGQFGLRNLSDDVWTYTSEKGEIVPIQKNAVAPLNQLETITFKKTAGTISLGAGKPTAEKNVCLMVKNYRVPLRDGQKIFACHVLAGSTDFSTVAGEITTNKKKPSLLGLRNLSGDEWTFIYPSTKERKTIRKGEVMPLSIESSEGILVNFRDISGKISFF